MSESSSPTSLFPRSPQRTFPLSAQQPRQTRSVSRSLQSRQTDLEGLLEKLERHLELVEDLLNEVEKREMVEGADHRAHRRDERRRRGSDDRGIRDGEEMPVSGVEERRRKRTSRADVPTSTNYDQQMSPRYPPSSTSKNGSPTSIKEGYGVFDRGREEARSEEHSSSEGQSDSSAGEDGRPLGRARANDQDIEMSRRGRTSRNTGGAGGGGTLFSASARVVQLIELQRSCACTASSLKRLAHTAAAFVRGRSPTRQRRLSISLSPSPSRSRSSSPRPRSHSPDHSDSSSISQNFHHQHRLLPSLRPFHSPKIKVDFKFPSSFNSTGLPTVEKNRYLPLRLQDTDSRPEHLSAHQREILEAGRHWRHRSRRRNSSGDGEGESEGGGPMFPCLLATVLVILPILLLSVVLGIIFRFSNVRV